MGNFVSVSEAHGRDLSRDGPDALCPVARACLCLISMNMVCNVRMCDTGFAC